MGNLPLSRSAKALVLVIYACASLQFIRFYIKTTELYLKMPLYLSGQERLPFQERVLPILFIRPLAHSAFFQRHFVSSKGIFTAEKGPFYLLSLIAFFVAAFYVQALYRRLTTTSSLALLVFPIFLFAMMWTYSIHIEANYSYPYDFPSVAFFAAGLYYIYCRKYLGLFVVILFGTFNRETTLFLILLYAIDGASRPQADGDLDRVAAANPWWMNFLRRFDLKLIKWPRLALLVVTWCAIKFTLGHIFAHNDASEVFNRVSDNLKIFQPRFIPPLLNICGYTLPIALIFHGFIRPARFANYLLIVIPWIAVMFVAGILVETRIYGELCSLCAVSLVLIMEGRLRTPGLPACPTPEDEEIMAVD